MKRYDHDFISVYKSLCRKYNRWTVWQDFIDMSACSISNSMEKRQDVREKREKLYLSIAKKYDKSELVKFSEMLALTVMALDENMAQDFLGLIFMDLNFGGDHGQFFTPWSVAKMMSEVTIGDDDLEAKIAEYGYISVSDCACGAGVMLIAFADSCTEHKVNYQQKVLFVGQDIDPTVAKMCYIQLSLLGCPGYVIVGDSISEPPSGSVLEPITKDPTDLWFTPFYYLRLWDFYYSDSKHSYDLPAIREKEMSETVIPSGGTRIRRHTVTIKQAQTNSDWAKKLKGFFRN